MEPRISILTLGVRDMERAYRFYHEGLGLPTSRNPEQGIIFFQMRGTVLALYPLEELAKDVSPEFSPDSPHRECRSFRQNQAPMTPGSLGSSSWMIRLRSSTVANSIVMRPLAFPS